MTTATLPTTDLYFFESCRPLVGTWWRRRPIERIGANCFRYAENLILLRRDEPEIMKQALRWSGRFIYVIDDDIDGAPCSTNLPSGYRSRLERFSETYYGQLLSRADVVVTSSDVLALRFAGDRRVTGEVVRLDPFWPLPVADQRHFDTPPRQPLEIAHLGTASHRGGLGAVTPAILTTLDRFPESRFTFIGRVGDHPALDTHPRVRRRNPMSWRHYQRWLARQRFHLALYPLEATLFDRARSINKLIEHAIVGAVGVYPADWASTSAVGRGAILAPGDLKGWEECMTEALSEPAQIRMQATQAAANMIAYTRPETQRSFWSRILNM